MGSLIRLKKGVSMRHCPLDRIPKVRAGMKRREHVREKSIHCVNRLSNCHTSMPGSNSRKGFLGQCAGPWALVAAPISCSIC
eukprot:1542301-Amphidinium_carterae.3